MAYKFENEFRLAHPETIGESDKHFDLDNYKDWLEEQLKKCDMCGKIFMGESHPVLDENYNEQSGLIQCSECRFGHLKK